jgi:hypothetical protein
MAVSSGGIPIPVRILEGHRRAGQRVVFAVDHVAHVVHVARDARQLHLRSLPP